MATDGWFQNWFQAAYFPPVWFAPADESHLTDDELRPEYRGSGKASGSRVPSKPSDDDLIRQVIDKWEVIEAARALDEIRSSGRGTQASEPEIAILPLGVKMDSDSPVSSATSQKAPIDSAAELRADIARENMRRARLLSSLI